jgi:hypothetical protein
LLLQRIKLRHHRQSYGCDKELAAEASLATANVQALHLILHEANLRFGVEFDASVAKEMDRISLARNRSVDRRVAKTTFAFNNSMFLLVAPFSFIGLRPLPS